jgi:3-oxoacyl-[acyl-carrier protein] reductase
MNDSRQRVALVTGAANGIGRAVALALAGRGIFVYINYLSDTKNAEKTLEQIIEKKGQAKLAPFDVTDQDACKKAVKMIVKEKRCIDILINNAGKRNDSLMAMMGQQAWQGVMDTNLTGFYNITKPVVKHMIKNRFGRIVNMASAAGQTGNSGQVNYSASKAGLIGATKALAREVAKCNITVNAVAPGFIETRMLDGIDTAEMIRSIPAQRIGTPEDVAHAVDFLCSEKSGYINGQVIGVNGGMI